MLDAVEALAMDALLFQCPDHAFDHAVLLRAVRGDELLLQPVAADQYRELAAGKNEPLSDLSRNSCVTRPKVPNLVIRACSNALAAVVAGKETRAAKAGDGTSKPAGVSETLCI